MFVNLPFKIVGNIPNKCICYRAHNATWYILSPVFSIDKNHPCKLWFWGPLQKKKRIEVFLPEKGKNVAEKYIVQVPSNLSTEGEWK